MKVGRPTKYTDELAQEICDTIANTSQGLDILCDKYPHWPRFGTIHKWVRENQEFSQLYARAKLDQASFMAEEIIKIADDNSLDYKINEEGKLVVDGEHVQRARLRVDSRKWLASKLAPKVYGDKSHTTIDATVRQEDAIKELE